MIRICPLPPSARIAHLVSGKGGERSCVLAAPIRPTTIPIRARSARNAAPRCGSCPPIRILNSLPMTIAAMSVRSARSRDSWLLTVGPARQRVLKPRVRQEPQHRFYGNGRQIGCGHGLRLRDVFHSPVRTKTQTLERNICTWPNRGGSSPSTTKCWPSWMARPPRGVARLLDIKHDARGLTLQLRPL